MFEIFSTVDNYLTGYFFAFTQSNNGPTVTVRPWENRGKCYMDRKIIQCLSNASQHVSMYPQPFRSYREILVGNCNFFLPPLAFNASVGVVLIGILGKRLVLIKVESWGYQAVKTV